MKKRRNFLIFDDKTKTVINISNITCMREYSGRTKFYMTDDSSYDVEEKLEDVLNAIFGKVKKREKTP